MSIVGLKIKIYKEQHLYIHYNINIRLLSRYDVENTQVKLIIHVWYAQPTCRPPCKGMQPTVLFSNSKHFFI